MSGQFIAGPHRDNHHLHCHSHYRKSLVLMRGSRRTRTEPTHTQNSTGLESNLRPSSWVSRSVEHSRLRVTNHERREKYNCSLKHYSNTMLVMNFNLNHLHTRVSLQVVSNPPHWALGVGWTTVNPLPAGSLFPALYHCDKMCWAARRRFRVALRAWSWFEDFGPDVLALQTHAGSDHAWYLSLWLAGLMANEYSQSLVVLQLVQCVRLSNWYISI